MICYVNLRHLNCFSELTISYATAGVTYVGSCGTLPTRYLITLCKVSYVSDLKAALCRLVDIPTPDNLVMAEVFDNHIAKIVVSSCSTPSHISFMPCLIYIVTIFQGPTIWRHNE